MIIKMNLMFVTGNFLTSGTRVIGIFCTKTSWAYNLSSIFSNIFLYSAHSLAIFFYYSYDQIYHDILSEVLKCLFSKLTKIKPVNLDFRMNRLK